MKKFTYKYVRPTDKNHGHTNVSFKGKYIGYLMPFNGLQKDANWYFTVEVKSFYGLPKILEPSYHSRTRKELIAVIENLSWE